MSMTANVPAILPVEHYNNFSIMQPEQKFVNSVFSAVEPLLGVKVPMSFPVSGYAVLKDGTHQAERSTGRVIFDSDGTVIDVPRRLGQSGELFYLDAPLDETLREYLATNTFWMSGHDDELRNSLVLLLDAWNRLEEELARLEKEHPPVDVNKPGGPAISGGERLAELDISIRHLFAMTAHRWHKDRYSGRKVSCSSHPTQISEEDPYPYRLPGEPGLPHTSTLKERGFTTVEVPVGAVVNFDTEHTWHKVPHITEPLVRSAAIGHYR